MLIYYQFWKPLCCFIFFRIPWLIKSKKNSIDLKKKCVTIYKAFQKFGVSKRFFFFFFYKLILLFWREVKLINVIVKTYIVRKDLYFKQMLFFLTLYSSKKKVSCSKKQYEAAKQFEHIINQHIRMLYEGSCDTEDWSNDAENSWLHHRYKLYFLSILK